MKQFFGQQVIERPRRGSSARSYKARQYGKIVLTEDGPEYFGATKIKMHMGANPHRTWSDDKNFTDVIGPLKGYLRSSCGRPWDKVYSEISSILGSAGYALGHIITDHLNVATNTWRGESGTIYNNHNGVEKVGGYRSNFYVDPWTGILCEAPQERSYHPSKPTFVPHQEPEVLGEKPKEHVPSIAISETSEYAQIKGIWYFAQFVWDEKVEEIKTKWRTFTRSEKTKRYTLKRQLGKKELRDLGLRRVQASNL